MTEHTSTADGGIRVTVIGNAYSIRVARWLKLFRLAGISTRIETAECRRSEPTVGEPVTFLVPKLLSRPSLLRYVGAGIVLSRKRLASGEILHAQSASGSGLTAWLSGHPYVLTTYGSEVFGAAERGRLYWLMVHRVLHGATRITATTPRMTQTLQDEFGVPAERIRTFTVGYDGDAFSPVDEASRLQLRSKFGLPANERVWVVNRRTHPLYRTAEVVRGFLDYCDNHPQGCLVVHSGDGDAEYRGKVREFVARSRHSSRVSLVEQFLSAEDVAEWLQAADLAISVPQTDQLATSILEGMACGAVPVLSDLEAYRPLHPCPAVRRLEDCTVDGLAHMFRETAKIPSEVVQQQRDLCVNFVREHFSEASVLNDVRELVGLPPLPSQSDRRAA